MGVIPILVFPVCCVDEDFLLIAIMFYSKHFEVSLLPFLGGLLMFNDGSLTLFIVDLKTRIELFPQNSLLCW